MNIHKLMIAVLVAGFVFTGCQPQVDVEQEALDLLETDREFATMSVQEGYIDAYNAYMIDDALLLPPMELPEVGREEIIGKWEEEGLMGVLDWEPQRAEVSSSADLGWTWGNWTFEASAENDSLKTWAGKYLMIWNKVDGSWKMAVNVWNDNPEAKEE